MLLKLTGQRVNVEIVKIKRIVLVNKISPLLCPLSILRFYTEAAIKSCFSKNLIKFWFQTPLENTPVKELSCSKDAVKGFTTLEKKNSFAGIFQGFWPQYIETIL